MYFRLSIKTDYEAIFTVNGSFTEGKKALSLSSDEIYYITVFPLNAALLPYTVKLTNGFVASNDSLASVYELSTSHRALRLLPRYAFVYACHEEAQNKSASLPTRFFRLVKEGKISEARNLLTTDLSSSVPSDALASFFDGYCDIVENDGKIYLVNGEGKAFNYRFTIENNLIAEVTEE